MFAIYISYISVLSVIQYQFNFMSLTVLFSHHRVKTSCTLKSFGNATAIP